MFGKKKKTANSVWKDHSFIGRHAVLEGSIRFVGALHVDGRIQGNVFSEEGCLHLHGEIHGDINVPNAVINGEIRGNVTCSEHLELAAAARVFGKVVYQAMEMDLGAQVSGSLEPLPATPALQAVQGGAA